MKPRLIAILERARADLLDAITAIHEDDMERAQEQLELVRDHFETASDELRNAA